MRDRTSLHSVELKELPIDLSEADKVVVHLALFDLSLALLHSFVVDLTDLSVLFCVNDQDMILFLMKGERNLTLARAFPRSSGLKPRACSR